ncbi:YhcN/YlaJ family sporulation lipoprotein [Mesobacillus subterraneus]|nr:YhcN/YlaJ family sporulation lipoprotein [Mesobacillus subterraneus]
MKKPILLLSSAVFALGLAGCGANNNAANDTNGNTGMRIQTNQAGRGTATDNQRLRVADRAERQVEQMAEVSDARVIISNNNAYVAVRLADDENGNARVNNAMDGNGRTFANNGRVDQDDDRAGNNGIIDGKGDAGTGQRQNAGTAGNRNNIFGADDGNGTDIGNARGGTRGNYSLANNAFEQEVADKVRQAHRGIDNVYVSVDNTMYDQMGTFSNDIRTNRNRDGLFRDFTRTMDGFFGGR